MVYQRTICLRFGFYLLPFRIGLKSSPILLRFLAAGMLENVDEQVLRTRRILGQPITNTLHVVTSEDRVGVIAEAGYQSIHFALVYVVQAQFVNVAWRLGVGVAERAETEHCQGPGEKAQNIGRC